MSEATVFRLGGGLRLVFALLRPSAGDRVIGARPQIDEYVLDVAHDVPIGAERRHHALLRRIDVLAPVNDNVGKVGIVLRLHVIAERRSVSRAFAVGAVANVAIGVVAAVAGIGEPIDRSVVLHLIGRIAFLVVIFAVLALDRGRISGAIAER